MGVIASLLTIFKADTSDFMSGSEKVRSEAKKTGGYMEQLKKTFGRRGAFGETMAMIRGAGAIAGLAEAARAVDELTKKAEEVQKAWGEGDLALKDSVSDLLRAIPIAGQFGDAVDRAWGLLSGRTTEVAQTMRQAAAQDLVSASIAERMRYVHDSVAETSEYVAKIQRQISALSMSGLPLKLFQDVGEAGDQIDAIRKAADKTKADRTKDFDARQKIIEDSLKSTPATIQTDAGRHRSSYGSWIDDTKTIANPAYTALEKDKSRIIAERKAIEDQIDNDARVKIAARAELMNRTALAALTGAASQAFAGTKSALAHFSGFLHAGPAAELKTWQDTIMDLDARGADVFAQTRTPLERYREQLDNLSDLLSTSSIDFDTYARAVGQAGEALGDIGDHARSATAVSVTDATFLRNGPSINSSDNPSTAVREQLRQAVQQTQIQLRMEKALRDKGEGKSFAVLE